MTKSEDYDTSSLVTPTQIRRWEQELDRLGRDMADIERRRSSLKMMIEGAAGLAPAESQTTAADTAAPATAVRPRRPVVPKRQTRRAHGKATWKEIIKEIVESDNRPMPYNEIKHRISKTALATRLQRSEKGFHNAIGKLVEDGSFVRYKAHLMTAGVYRQFRTDLAAGIIRDLRVPNIAHHSPMGEAITQLMSKRARGADSGYIISELRKNAEFAQQMAKNKTHVYNVLKRLVAKNDLAKRGRRYFFVHLKNEAPGSREPGAVNHHDNGSGDPSSTGNGKVHGNVHGLAVAPGATPGHSGD